MGSPAKRGGGCPHLSELWGSRRGLAQLQRSLLAHFQERKVRQSCTRAGQAPEAANWPLPPPAAAACRHRRVVSAPGGSPAAPSPLYILSRRLRASR